MKRIWACLVAVIGAALLLASLGGSSGCAKSEKTPTTIALVSSNNPSLYGEMVFFTATIEAEDGGTAGGTVAFYDGATLLASVSQKHGLGQFTHDISTLAVGSHDIVAVYEGNSSYAGSTSEVLTQVVSQTPTAWERQSPSVQANSLEGVWGSSSTDVFAVGWRGTILHYDGSAWSAMPTGTNCYLYGIWGSSSSDVFAVGGHDSTILHYDGSTWSGMDTGTGCYLYGVWGTGPADVFAVGVYRTILHYEGSTWSAMDSGTSEVDLECVWGSAWNDVFAVGQNGVILHYNGSTWSAMDSGTTSCLSGVWGNSSSDVYAVGQYGVILHYDGNAWTAVNSGAGVASLHWVWGTGPRDVFAVGDHGTILHYDGSTWSLTNSGTSDYLQCVWGSAGNDVFAAGWYGAFLHYAG